MIQGATALEERCLACDALPAPGDDRCASCGSPLAAPQRRVVTILFADLSGYTSLCAHRDPEDVHLLVRPLMNALRRLCQDVGGVVPSIEGDGFMAVFGAQHATEDDPLRALTAAVGMQTLMAERTRSFDTPVPGLRIGLNLGEVVVAPSWEQSGFSLVGDAVNVASRLCDLAEPGELVVASQLIAVLPQGVSWTPVEEVLLRNRDQPVRARRLEMSGLASVPMARTRPSAAVPLVGRADVWRELAGQRAVVVTGDPGVGKSRLVDEWARSQGARLLRGLCASFAGTHTNDVVAQLVRPLDALSGTVVGPTTARRVSRLLGAVVDSTEVDTAEEQREAASELIIALAQAEPLIVVLEDAHWAPSELLHWLSSLIARASDHLRVVCTSRSHVELDVPELHLGPLGDDDVAELVGHLLPGADDALVDALRARAGGVPLVLEQCASLLVEEGLVELFADGARLVDGQDFDRVPTSMRLFVAARLELLEQAQKDVLGAAAVAGDGIAPALLRHLSRRDVSDEIEALVAKGMLAIEMTSEGTRLRWRHAVVRDVVYDSLMLSRRVHIHRNAAEWFSIRLPREGLAGRAWHLEAAVGLSAGRGAPDCSLVSEACHALAMLAHGSLVEDPHLAAGAAERGLALVEGHPQCDLDRLDLDLLLAEASEHVGAAVTALEVAERALHAAAAASDPLGEARASLVLGRVLWPDDPPRARELLARARAVFEERRDVVGVATVDVDLARFGQFSGIREYVAAHEAAFRAAEWAGDFRWSNFMAQLVAVHAYATGREAHTSWSDIVRQGMRPADTAGRGRLALGEALLELHAHDYDLALERARVALELGREARVRHTSVNAAVVGLEAAACSGRLDEGDAYLAQVDALIDERRTQMLTLNRGALAPLLVARRGQHDDADRLLDAAFRANEESGIGENFVRELHTARARLLLDRGRSADALGEADAAVAACRRADEPFVGLRARLLRLAAAVSSRSPVTESMPLQWNARDWGAPHIEGLVARWLELDDLLRGNLPLVTVTLPEAPPGVEGTALDHEVHAFLDQDWDRLLEASTLWRGLGATVWPARPLCWYATVTGDESHLDDARQLLLDAGAPEGLEEQLRAQPMPFRRTLGG